jgi:hypothetical protein
MMGYDYTNKAYRVYKPLKRKIFISRDIVFDETKLGTYYLPIPDPSDLYFPNDTTIAKENSKNDLEENLEYLTLKNSDSEHNHEY